MELDFDKLIAGSSVQQLREKLGLSEAGVFYLVGTGTANPQWSLQGPKSEIPITNPSLGILVRFLGRYPKYNFMPEYPDVLDSFEALVKLGQEPFAENGNKKKLIRNLAVILGKNAYNTSQWFTSNTIPRLLRILMTAIEQEGADGLQKYLDVVEEEAVVRGFENFNTLLKAGDWASDTSSQEGRITGADVQALREFYGLSSNDVLYMVGYMASPQWSMNQWSLQGARSEFAIPDPSLCILVRLLTKYPEYYFMPTYPEISEVFEAVANTDKTLFQDRIQESRTALRRFAILFGKNGWNSTQWFQGNTASPTVNRLLLIVMKCLKQKNAAERKKALDNYIRIVEEEAVARELGGLKSLYRTGKWESQSFGRMVKDEFDV